MPLTFWCKAIFGTARASPSIFSLDFFAASGYSLLDGSVHTPRLEFDKTAGALALFQAALPAEFFRQQRRAVGLPPEEGGVYTTAEVVMLMILQRLVQGRGTLSRLVQQLLSGQLGDLLQIGRASCRERVQ